MKHNDLEKSLVDTVEYGQLAELATQYGEIALDVLLVLLYCLGHPT